MSGYARALRSALLFLCVSWCAWSAAQDIAISAGLENQPFGAAVSEILGRAGLKASIEYFPAERSLQMIERGKVDAEFVRAAPVVAPFADKITLVGPIACLEVVAFKRVSDGITVTNIKDLDKLRVAVPLASRFAAGFVEENDIHAERVMTHDNLFNMLDRSRFDVAVTGSVVGFFALKNLGLTEKIVQTGPVLRAEPMYLVLRNERKEWAPRIQAEFDKAINNDSWQATVGAINKAAGLPAHLGVSCLKKKR